MAKRAPQNTLDAQLDYIAACDRIFICSAEPTTYAEASATFNVGTKTVTPLTDFPRAAGTGTDARQVTVNAQSAIPISTTTTGTTLHVAVGHSGTSTLRLVTTAAAQALTSGNTASTPAWVYNLTQPD